MLFQIFKVNSKCISFMERIKNIPKFAYSKHLTVHVCLKASIQAVDEMSS